MPCEMNRDELSDFVNYRLPPERQRSMKQHIMECEDCLAEVVSISTTLDRRKTDSPVAGLTLMELRELGIGRT